MTQELINKTTFMRNKTAYNFAIKGSRDWTIAKMINNIFVSYDIEPVPHPYDDYTAPGLYYYIGHDNKVHSGHRYDLDILERVVLSTPKEYYELLKRNLI